MTVEDKAIDRFRGCLIGLAIGDAIGTTVEFKARGTFEPVTDMVGGGPFDLEAGQWTDDTSMALCLAESLLISNGFDADDLMQRFCMWWDEGYLSSTGECRADFNWSRMHWGRTLVQPKSFRLCKKP